MMRNLLPHIVIGIIGVIGLLIWGFWGLLGGLAVGYATVTMFGLTLIGISGGILPRKVRRETAETFVSLHGEWLSSIIPPENSEKLVVYIERLLEKIFKKAAVVGPSTSSGMSYWEVSSAVEIIKGEEQHEEVMQIIDGLWEFIEKEWYTNPEAGGPNSAAGTMI